MQDFLNFLQNNLLLIIGAAVLIVLFFSSFIKVPPNTIAIISGLKKTPRVISGRAGLKVPFFERKDKLSLKQMIMEVGTGTKVSTNDYIEVELSAVVKAKISEETEMLEKATKNFLNQSVDQTIKDLQVPLQAILAEITGSLKFDEIITEREKFGKLLQKRAEATLAEFGVEVVSCVLGKVEEETGLIKALGMEHTTGIQKQAAILEAEAEREIVAKRIEEKQVAQDLHNEAEAEIMKKNADVALQLAELDKEVELKKIAIAREVAERDNELKLQQIAQRKDEEEKRAAAELVFEEATLLKRMEFEKMQADAALAQEEEKLKLHERTAEIKTQIMEAEGKKAADIEAYKQQQIADANMYIATKAAEAQKIQVETTNYILEREAETAKLRDLIQKQEAETKHYLKQQEAAALKLKVETDTYILEQEANADKMVGLAEAEVIKAQGLAEAHTRKLKAEAMKDYGQAAIIDMVVNSIPDIAKSVVDKDGSGADIIVTMEKVQELVNAATGLNLKEISKDIVSTVDSETVSDEQVEVKRIIPANHPKANAPTGMPVRKKRNQMLV